MTTDRPDPQAASPLSVESGPGERLRRLHRRRVLVREELLVVGFLLILLAVTVAVLATQWLGSGPSTTTLGRPHPTPQHQTLLQGFPTPNLLGGTRI